MSAVDKPAKQLLVERASSALADVEVSYRLEDELLHRIGAQHG